MEASNAPKASSSIVDAAVIQSKSTRKKGAFGDELNAALGLPSADQSKALEELGRKNFDLRAGASSSRLIPVAKLSPSPTNPRKTFVHLEELGASLQQGVIQSLVVRPWVDRITGLLDSTRFEVVCGERRLRAAKLVGIKELPCEVREIPDAVVLDYQATENLQRENLTPIEEAESFDAIMRGNHFTADQVAQKVGSTASTVRGRCKLLALGPEGRVAVAEGWLPQSVGTVLARSCPTHALQAKWLKANKRPAYDTDGAATKGVEVIGARWAIQNLQREFTHALKDAPFDPKDEMLIGEQVDGDSKAGPPGACLKCPHNAANGERGLFDDLGAKPGQICTFTPCYQAKCAAAVKLKTAELEARGVEILKGEKADKAFGYTSELAKLDETNYSDPKKRTWRQILEKLPEDKAPEIVAAVKDGHVVELVSKKALTSAVAKSSGAKWAKEDEVSAEKRKKEKNKFKEQQAERTKRAAVTAAIAMAIGRTKQPDVALWRELADKVFREVMLSDGQLKAMGYEEDPKKGDATDQHQEAIEKGGSLEQLRSELFGWAVMESDAAQDFEHRGDDKALRALAKRYGVKVDDILTSFENAEKAEALMKGGKGKGK